MLRRSLLSSLLFCSALACNPKSTLRQKAPAIEVTPTPALFQPLAVGKSAAIALQVKNTGNIDPHLGKDPYVVEADNDNLVEYDTPAVLAKDCAGKSRAEDTRLTIVPGDCAVLVLRYAPQNTDKDDAALVFESDDPDHPTLSIPVGLGAPPHLQACTVNESGGDGACDTPQALVAGAKISFTVRFSPDDASDQVGALLLPNDGRPDQYLRLHGTALLSPTCRLEASASTVSFGQVVRGQSAQRNVSVATAASPAAPSRLCRSSSASRSSPCSRRRPAL